MADGVGGVDGDVSGISPTTRFFLRVQVFTHHLMDIETYQKMEKKTGVKPGNAEK